MPPFQEFTPFFGPDELDAMQAAYNAAWVQLLAGAAVITPQTPQRGEMKNKLAQVILAAACTGKRDKERLEDVALRALARRQSAKP
jgi:hypothetical protein